MGLLGWWAGLPVWLRYGTALAFLAASTVLWFAGRFWPWGWAVGRGEEGLSRLLSPKPG